MKKSKTKSKLIELETEKGYIDAEFEPVRTTKNTGAKVVVGFVSATIVIATLVGLKVVSEPPLDLIANQPTTVVTEFKPYQEQLTLTKDNGEKIIVDENSHLMGAIGVAILSSKDNSTREFSLNINDIEGDV